MSTAAGVEPLDALVDPNIPDLIPSDITFRYNHLFKPAWRNAIVPAPNGSRA